MNLSEVKELVENGVSAENIAKQFNLSYQMFQYHLRKMGTSIKELKKSKIEPQSIDKRKYIEAYKTATSPGIKAGIARKFNKDFGVSLKIEMENPSIIEKPKLVKVPTTKEIFAKKEVELLIPKKLSELLDDMNNKIIALEKRVMILENKI